jgi:hypothetical protein
MAGIIPDLGMVLDQRETEIRGIRRGIVGSHGQV